MEETLLKEEEEEDDEDMEHMREDLESTKQLLELEVRSKKLLEKDNKRLAQELEKLKMEMCKQASASIGIIQDGKDSTKDATKEDTAKASRRNSVMATKRHSVIRLLSESEGREGHEGQDSVTPAPPPESSWAASDNCSNGEILNETDETEIETDETDENNPAVQNAPENNTSLKSGAVAESFYDEEIAEIDEMREEVDEARKLAEEWEAKYKEMQRQMSDVESSRYKIHSLIIDNVPIQKKASATTSEFEGMYVRVSKEYSI